jgi:Fe-S oxidoreductase
MMIDDLIYMLREMTIRTGYPIPIDREEIYRWARGLNLSRKGETILYSGALYQVMPYIDTLVNIIKRIEGNDVFKTLMSRIKFLAKTPSLLKVFLKVDPSKKDTAMKVLRSISLLLKEAGIEHSYLYEQDLYSGVLLYDLGLEEEFYNHAKKVYKALKESEAKVVITVDPHTTYVLRRIYPRYIDNFDLEVVSYLECISDRLPEVKTKDELHVVIHDPCFYARYEKVIEQPRKVLEASGVKVLEPKRSGRYTSCCGGPIESSSPTLAEKIAKDRLNELVSISRNIITLCPICYSNLSRVKTSDIIIKDLALFVAERRGLIK